MMLDTPQTYEQMPVYVESVLEPLARGEGVACFVIGGDYSQTVLFASHRLRGRAATIAHSSYEYARASQAIAIQHEARKQAVEEGYWPVVE